MVQCWESAYATKALQGEQSKLDSSVNSWFDCVAVGVNQILLTPECGSSGIVYPLDFFDLELRALSTPSITYLCYLLKSSIWTFGFDCRYVLESQHMKKFFDYIQLPNFDIAADAAATFKVELILKSVWWMTHLCSAGLLYWTNKPTICEIMCLCFALVYCMVCTLRLAKLHLLFY